MATDFIEGSATFTNGDNVVTAVTLTQNTLSGVAEGVIVKVSSDPVIDNVEAVKALAVDSFQLRNVWPHATGTYTFMMNFSPEAIKSAATVMQQATDALNAATADSLSETEADLRYLQLTDADDDYLKKTDAELEYVNQDGYSQVNKVIDARLDYWYEGTASSTQGYSSSTTLFSVYDGTVTSTRETLSGASQVVIDIPTAQYCKKTTVAASGSYALERTVIPNVRNYAGQDITVSVYVEVNSDRDVAIELCQNFGTTGSARVTGIGSQLVSVTSSFARYDVQVSVPGVVGKTIDDDSYLEINVWLSQDGTYNTRAASLSNQTGDTSITCIQINKGDVAYGFEELGFEQATLRISSIYQDIPHLWHSGYYVGASVIMSYLLTNTLIGDATVTVGSTSSQLNIDTAVLTLDDSLSLTSLLTGSSSGIVRTSYDDIVIDARLGDTIV